MESGPAGQVLRAVRGGGPRQQGRSHAKAHGWLVRGVGAGDGYGRSDASTLRWAGYYLPVRAREVVDDLCVCLCVCLSLSLCVCVCVSRWASRAGGRGSGWTPAWTPGNASQSRAVCDECSPFQGPQDACYLRNFM